MSSYPYHTSGPSATSSSRYNVYVPPSTVRSSSSSRVKRSTSCSASSTPAPAYYALHPSSYAKENCSIRPADSGRHSHRSSRGRTQHDETYYVSSAHFAAATAPSSGSSSTRQSRSSETRPLKSSFRRSQSADKHVHFPDQRPRPPLRQNHTWHAGDKTPYEFRAAPLPPTGPVDMHPIFTSSRLHSAPISYDITFSPSSSSILDRKTRGPVAGSTLAEPATSPAVPVTSRLVLTSHKFPWAVVVHPSSSGGARTSPITNLDVLHAVHATLRVRVTAEEWESLGADSMAQRKVRRAYERRCEQLGGGWEGGVRRIDWLGGKTRLAGVEVDRHAAAGPSACRLVFAHPK